MSRPTVGAMAAPDERPRRARRKHTHFASGRCARVLCARSALLECLASQGGTQNREIPRYGEGPTGRIGSPAIEDGNGPNAILDGHFSLAVANMSDKQPPPKSLPPETRELIVKQLAKALAKAWKKKFGQKP